MVVGDPSEGIGIEEPPPFDRTGTWVRIALIQTVVNIPPPEAAVPPLVRLKESPELENWTWQSLDVAAGLAAAAFPNAVWEPWSETIAWSPNGSNWSVAMSAAATVLRRSEVTEEKLVELKDAIGAAWSLDPLGFEKLGAAGAALVGGHVQISHGARQILSAHQAMESLAGLVEVSPDDRTVVAYASLDALVRERAKESPDDESAALHVEIVALAGPRIRNLPLRDRVAALIEEVGSDRAAEDEALFARVNKIRGQLAHRNLAGQLTPEESELGGEARLFAARYILAVASLGRPKE